MVGYIGMAILLASYLVRTRLLLPTQFLACLFLFAYAVQVGAVPFILLNLAIAASIITRWVVK